MIRFTERARVREPGAAPATNLYRGNPNGCVLGRSRRDDDIGEEDVEDGGDSGEAVVENTVLRGHFAVFNIWTEICSWYEGEFMERIASGAFSKTFRENAGQIKCQFDHGHNELVGGNLLGPFDVLREDAIGAYYEVPLIDAPYVTGVVLPQLTGKLLGTGELRGSLLGSSFRFSVVKDMWNTPDVASATNPEMLPERTILEVELFEAGPVVWPAYPDATSSASQGMRSLTDHYLDRLRERAGHRDGAADGTPNGTSSTAKPPLGHLSDSHGHDPVALQQQARAFALR
jgi:phage head maturation protease